jgi:hypothetical protein
LKSDEVFPLETSYAKAWNEQIGLEGVNRPSSILSKAMKSQLRQYPASNDLIFEDRFQMILGQMKRRSITEFLNDFYRFPLNPSANAFEAARLLEQYMNDGEEEPIRRYFANRNVTHLEKHSFGYYPIYQLFFLMTRYASYPMSENQLQLAAVRVETEFDSPARTFIDAIFEFPIYNLEKVLQIVQEIQNYGPAAAGKSFETTNEDWVRWADEYLLNAEKDAIPIENYAAGTWIIADKLYTWSDLQIKELAKRLNFKLPFRSEFPTRYSYLMSVAGTISYYRADSSNTLRWIEMTNPD